MIVTLEPKWQWKLESIRVKHFRGQQYFPLYRSAPNPTYSFGGTWKPRTMPDLLGKEAAKPIDRGAGLGGWKKQRPHCNGADMSCNITQRESEPTSDWSFIARDLVEPTL